MVAEPAAVPSALAVRGLRVALPDGRILIDGVDLTIGAGEVVVLLGGSGAGKSTFARVLFERDELELDGFEVVAAQLALDRDQLGLVPQRGALFDHLDIRGNLELALRHARRDPQPSAAAAIGRNVPRGTIGGIDRNDSRATTDGIDRDGPRATTSGIDRDDSRATTGGIDRTEQRAGGGSGIERKDQRGAASEIDRELLLDGAGSDGDGDEAAAWLARVGLDAKLAAPGTPVTQLSGGQAQRVAVARVLASRRKLVFLDEPSVGLDPHRVRMLARLIRQQVKALGISAIVVTHDVALAAGVADRLFLLSLEHRRLEPLFAERWPGALEDPGHDDDERGRWLIELERTLVAHLESHGDRAPPVGVPPVRRALARAARRLDPLLAPFRVAAIAALRTPVQLARHPRDFAIIARRVAAQTLLRPLPFYAIVSTLIGYTVLLVISKVGGAGVRPDALLRQIGGSYVVALAPAISALLFVAASGSATNAWLGSMGLTKQTLALEALGVDRRSYLWAPAWLAAALCYLAVAVLFALGMIAGGVLVCRSHGVGDAWQLLTGDLLDPRPERVRYAVRAAFLVWIYAWGIASDVIAKGGAAKPEADAVTRGMTASVVACTLWVVTWELVTVLAVFRA
jgi:ABC-type transporter Mla maintaining outer membrane lipid asymmetry ATPase subunit MlaF/ABC-type transporter Mla maintaining outer membrane lipid asymmetry permease subunit MlaE